MDESIFWHTMGGGQQTGLLKSPRRGKLQLIGEGSFRVRGGSKPQYIDFLTIRHFCHVPLPPFLSRRPTSWTPNGRTTRGCQGKKQRRGRIKPFGLPGPEATLRRHNQWGSGILATILIQPRYFFPFPNCCRLSYRSNLRRLERVMALFVAI